MKQIFLVGMLSCLTLSQGALVRAELIHGSLAITPRWESSSLYCDVSIDFSTQSLVAMSSTAADLCYQDDFRAPGALPYYFYVLNGMALTKVGGSLEELELAPEVIVTTDGTVVENQTYVGKTSDGLYVKLSPRSIDNGGCCSVVVEFYVQTDGSRNLGPQVPTRSTTWGSVKALYR